MSRSRDMKRERILDAEIAQYRAEYGHIFLGKSGGDGVHVRRSTTTPSGRAESYGLLPIEDELIVLCVYIDTDHN